VVVSWRVCVWLCGLGVYECVCVCECVIGARHWNTRTLYNTGRRNFKRLWIPCARGSVSVWCDRSVCGCVWLCGCVGVVGLAVVVCVCLCLCRAQHRGLGGEAQACPEMGTSQA